MGMKIHNVEMCCDTVLSGRCTPTSGESYFLLFHDCPTPTELPQAVNLLTCISEQISFSLDPAYRLLWDFTSLSVPQAMCE